MQKLIFLLTLILPGFSGLICAQTNHPNPDYVFNIPQQPGTNNYGGVNLFTGDLNDKVALATIAAGEVQFELLLLYNSRSAALTPLVTQNEVGGLGWKLGDYPKVGYDNGSSTYWLVFPDSKEQLYMVSSGSSTASFESSGSTHRWKITCTGWGQSTNMIRWEVASLSGIHYVFDSAPITLSEDRVTAQLWNLTKMRDAFHTDSLLFSYNGRMLHTITSSDDEQLLLSYSSQNRLGTIYHYQIKKNNLSWLTEKTLLSYIANFPTNTSYLMLSGIQREINQGDADECSNVTGKKIPTTRFVYADTGYAGALVQRMNESGEIIKYVYGTELLGNAVFHPVVQINFLPGSVYTYEDVPHPDYTPVTIKYEGLRALPDGIFGGYNECSVLPGVDKIGSVYSESSTSFEDSLTDPLFEYLQLDYFSTEHVLSGEKSIKFDTQGAGFDMYVRSRMQSLSQASKLAADRGSHSGINYQGTHDSITVSFFCYDKHKSYDVNFKLKTEFFNSRGQVIDDPQLSLKMDDSNYGKWVPFVERFAVPEDAISFKLTFEGGSSVGNHDFYMDNVSISGARYDRVGSLVYHFFNGDSRASLVHLPDEYVQVSNNEQIVGYKYTGFEQGDPFSEWVSLDNDCKPKQASSTASKLVAYNGNSALRLKACKSGDKSRIYGTLAVPRNTNRVAAGFKFSCPQISGLKFRFRITVNNVNKDTTITATDSYFFNTTFLTCLRNIPIASNATQISFELKITDAGNSEDVNDIYIDDLTFTFLQDNHISSLVPALINVADPLLLGQNYHVREFTANQQEVKTTEFIYNPQRLSGRAPYLSFIDARMSERGAKLQHNLLFYNSNDQLIETFSSWNRELADKSHVLTENKTSIRYAREYYPVLAESDLYMPDEPAIIINYNKASPDSAWIAASGSLVQWKLFTNLSQQNGGKNSRWAPWRTYQLIAPISDQDLTNLDLNLRSNPQYTPPSTMWQLENEVVSIDGIGNILEEITEETQVLHQYTAKLSEAVGLNSAFNRACQETAFFKNVTAGSAFYNGMETYEMPLYGSSAYNTNYAYTGLRSAYSAGSFNFQFDKTGITTTSFQVAFWFMPTGTSLKIQVVNTSTNTTLLDVTRSFSSAQLNKWQYVEFPLTITETSGSLRFTISNSGNGIAGYVDDFRFSPADAMYEMQVYDFTTGSLTAQLGINGNVSRSLGNYPGTSSAVVGPDEQPIEVTCAYLSRGGSGNSDKYNANDPDCSTTFRLRGKSVACNWGEISSRDQWYASSAIHFTPKTVSFPGNAPQQLTLASSYLPANHLDWGVSMRLKGLLMPTLSSGTAQSMTVHFGGTAVKLRYAFSTSPVCSLQVLNNGTWQQVASIYLVMNGSGVVCQDLQVVFAGNKMLIWVDGKVYHTSVSVQSNTITQLQLSSESGSLFSAFHVDDLLLMNDPLVQLSYSDAAGNELQEQSLKGNDLVVSETVYNVMQLPEIETKPVLLQNTAPGYNTGFVTSFDWRTGKINGTVTNAAAYITNGSNDENYVYSRTIFAKSPEVRPELEFNAGKDFALRDQTNLEKAKAWMCNDFPGYLNDAITAAQYVFDAVDIITNPEMAPVIITADAAGLVLSHVNFSKQNADHEFPLTRMIYDKNKNPRAIYLPMANRKHSPVAAQVALFQYDFQNQLILESYPESGTNHYAYDRWQRVRFEQTEDNKTAGIVQYYKYDNNGRVIETGYWSSIWDQQFMNSEANADTYPTGSFVTITNQYFYDGLNSDSAYYPGKRNQLTSRRTNNPDGSHTVEYFWYDAFDQLKSMRTVITETSGSSTTYNVSYAYDMVGNITTIVYPPHNNQNFIVKYGYDKLNNIISVGDESNARTYAAYYWNPDKTLSGQSMYGTTGRRFHTSYDYNAPAWNTGMRLVDSLNQSFSEISRTDYNYNMIDSWWQNLWGQKYYTGQVAESKHDFYRPYNSSDYYVQNFRGFTYDSLGRLNQTFSVIGPTSGGGGSGLTGDHPTPWIDSYNLNGNLLSHRFVFNTHDSGIDTTQYTFAYDDNHNRLQSINFYKRNYDSYSHKYRFDQDQLTTTVSRSGFYTGLTYQGHAPAEDSYHPVTGAVDSTSARTFAYNAKGMLESATWSGTAITSGSLKIQYDGQLTRLRKISTTGNTTTTTTCIYGNSTSPLLEIISTGSTVKYNYYVQGPDGNIALVQQSGSSTESWFMMKDRTGSVQELVNRNSGTTDEEILYDDYGTPKLISGTIKSNCLFTGHWYDPELQVYDFGARLYDPWMRQFLSPDPAHQDMGVPYAYSAYDPVNRIDPDGAINLLTKGVVNAGEVEVELARDQFKAYNFEQLMDYRDPKTGKPIRNKPWKIDIRRRLNFPDAALFNEIIAIRSKGGQLWEMFKNLIRPGRGKHEFFNVANTAYWLELGAQLDDLQQVVLPTSKTHFIELSKSTVLHNHNNTSVSSLAHKAIANDLKAIKLPTTTGYDDATRSLLLTRANEIVDHKRPGQIYGHSHITQSMLKANLSKISSRPRKSYTSTFDLTRKNNKQYVRNFKKANKGPAY